MSSFSHYLVFDRTARPGPAHSKKKRQVGHGRWLSVMVLTCSHRSKLARLGASICNWFEALSGASGTGA
jgi:hypothetical protein